MVLFENATRAALISDTLPFLNLSKKAILVSNSRCYKEKTIKLLPYYSLSMEVTSPKKN